MLDNSDDEENDESSSLLPKKKAHQNNLLEDRKSPHPNYSNYVSLPDSGHSTPTTDVNSKDEQIDSSNFDTASETHGFSFFALPRKQKAILCSICMADFLSYLSLSLLAPFFPQEVSIMMCTVGFFVVFLGGWVGCFFFVEMAQQSFFIIIFMKVKCLKHTSEDKNFWQLS